MPTNDEIDDLLKQLAIAAKNHQSRTWGRQQAMSQLITEIEKYKIINCPQTTNFYSESNQIICSKKNEVAPLSGNSQIPTWERSFYRQCFAVHLCRRRILLVYVVAVEVQKLGGAAKWNSHIYLLLNTSRLSRCKALSSVYSANSRPVQILMFQFEDFYWVRVL